MLKRFDPKFLDVVTDAKQKKSLKKKRRLMTFWRRLSTEQLASIQKQFTNPDAAAASGGVHARGRSHDSFDAGGSVLSSAATMAIENSVTEEPSTTEHMSFQGAANIVIQTEAQRPKHSFSQPEWVAAVCNAFSSNKIANDAAMAFNCIVSSKNSSFITWGDVLDFYIKHVMQPSQAKKASRISKYNPPLKHENKFRSSQHSKRETIVKIVGVSSGTTYVYIVVSKFGNVGIYDEKFRLQRQYEIDIDTDPDADLDVAASDPGWITDALWMDNSKHAVYTTSLRTMHFFDASASVHYEEYRAFGFHSIPTCIDHSFNPDNPDDVALLMFGDESGGLTIVHFLQPINSLFAKEEVDSVQCLFWPDVVESAQSYTDPATGSLVSGRNAEFVKIVYTPNVHSDSVLGVRYLASNKTVITISRDPHASLLIRQVENKFDSYIFRLSWGVRCFDYKDCKSVNIIATASNDKIVRLWNPVVTSKPTAILVGHKAGINDVKVHAERRYVFSYDKKAVLKVWDLDSANCLQTLNFHFPSFKVLGKTIEFGQPAFYTDTANPTMMIATCCEHLTRIDLMELEFESSTSEESEDEGEVAGHKTSGGTGSKSKQGGETSKASTKKEDSSQVDELVPDDETGGQQPSDPKSQEAGTLSQASAASGDHLIEDGPDTGAGGEKDKRSPGFKSVFRKKFGGRELLTEEDSVTSEEEEEEHDDVTDDEGDDDMMMDGGIPGLSGWMSTKKVIRSRFFGRAFKSKQKQKQEKERLSERKSEFRLFGDHLTGTFSDEEDVDPDWGRANKDNSSLNVLRVQKYLNNSRMKELARDNMPFMGLEIHGLADAKLRTNLPHTASMIAKGIRIETLEDLVNMSNMESAAPTGADSHAAAGSTSEAKGPRGGGGKKTTGKSSVKKKKMPSKKQGQGSEAAEGEERGSGLLTVKRGGEAAGQPGAQAGGGRGAAASFGTSGGKLMGIIEAEEKSGTPSLITEGDSSNADEE